MDITSSVFYNNIVAKQTLNGTIRVIGVSS